MTLDQNAYIHPWSRDKVVKGVLRDALLEYFPHCMGSITFDVTLILDFLHVLSCPQPYIMLNGVYYCEAKN